MSGEYDPFWWVRCGTYGNPGTTFIGFDKGYESTWDTFGPVVVGDMNFQILNQESFTRSVERMREITAKADAESKAYVHAFMSAKLEPTPRPYKLHPKSKLPWIATLIIGTAAIAGLWMMGAYHL